MASFALPADSSAARTALGPLAVAGLASLGAGAIHAAAIGVHSEHRQAVLAFTGVAAFQLAWGTLALVRSNRWIAAVGVAGQAAIIGGWIMAKTRGIGFIDGMAQPEQLQLADGLAAGLATAAVLAVAVATIGSSLWRGQGHLARTMLGGLGAGVSALALVGMVSAGSHGHAGGGASGTHGGGGRQGGGTESAAGHHGTDDTDDSAGSGGHVGGEAAVVPPKPYDPEGPIDLGGVPGVTAEQQAEAENLIAITLIRLPHFSDPATAQAAGYHSIGDAGTGYEHFINWDLIDDGRILNPDFPESLVYRAEGGKRTLVSAMYLLQPGTTLDTTPELGGKLTQWHIHDNLCFTRDETAPKVAGLTQADGTCAEPLQKFEPVPMIHVWIVPHKCGPFSALEGVGAGQVREGEEHLCDHAHGS